MPRLLVALLVALSLLLSAGRIGAEQPIRLWHAYRGEERRALEEILALWSGAPVELLGVPYDAFAAKLSAAIPLGEGPELFIDAHERLGDYRERGLVVEIGDALDDPTRFHSQAIAAVSLEGRAFGVPLSQKCVALYFNKALVAEPPSSLEGLGDVLRAPLAEGTFLLAYETRGVYAHAPILSGFGGELLTADERFGFIGPAAEQSLRFVKAMADRREVPESADGALVANLFRSGKAAFAISGPWLASDLSGSGLDYGVAVLPVVSETGLPMRPLLTVEAVMLSPQGAARAEARALARHLSSLEAALLRQRVARTVSARRDVEVRPDDELLTAFVLQASQADPMRTSVAMRAVWEPAEKAMRKVMQGTVVPAVALAEAERRFEDVRRPPPAPASPAPALVALGAALLAGAWWLLRRCKDAAFKAALHDSLPAYRYVAHAVVAVGLLVVLPLVAGAVISLWAGRPGDHHYVGLANFVDILTARGGPLFESGSFYLVLLVTVLWTGANLALHLGIGMALGLLLARPSLRMRGVYRVLLIVPWAVPNYVTALAWKGMFHRQFGTVTALTEWLGDALGTRIEPIAWFARFSTAFAANVATNVWLGFPFMMVVTLAALTAVPRDVLEAADVDGATRWERFWLVTLPIIRPSMLPAAVLGAIWTFNMFNVVFLVSGGEPDGQTDILVSEAYRWAFTRQAQYGYAAAYAVIIFALLFAATRLPSWITTAGRWKTCCRVLQPAPLPPRNPEETA